MSERLANLGYLALVKESAKNTPTQPTDFIPLYDESLNTDMNFQAQKPIYGNKFDTFKVLKGQRAHKGDFTVIAEPNTTGKLFDMLLTRTNTTGTTHTFELSNTVNPSTYTIDVSTGAQVSRYWGVQASKVVPNWATNELQWKVSVSAIGSFQGREIATVSSSTITLGTTYDDKPTKGLVVGDLVRITKTADGTTLDTTVATINADGVTITLVGDASAFAAGDMLTLRPATPSFALLDSFLWAKTQFCFADTAANALTAAQTRVEQGSTFSLTHAFNNDSGEPRSGGFDPDALIRALGSATVEVKRFFDTPDDLKRLNAMTKSALAIRHYAGDTNQYELTVVFNHLKTDGEIVPTIKSNEILYSDIKYQPMYSETDAKAFYVINKSALTTI